MKVCFIIGDFIAYAGIMEKYLHLHRLNINKFLVNGLNVFKGLTLILPKGIIGLNAITLLRWTAPIGDYCSPISLLRCSIILNLLSLNQFSWNFRKYTTFRISFVYQRPTGNGSSNLFLEQRDKSTPSFKWNLVQKFKSNRYRTSGVLRFCGALQGPEGHSLSFFLIL